jgi:nitrogen fixation/metabolism regulation signal transduction histidine kinase
MEFFRSAFFRMSISRRKGILDLIVVFSIFVVSSALVLGLFPHSGGSEGRLMYLYTMMSVPIIIGIYFIITSFRRSVVRDVSERESSIRSKIMLIFVFVAVLPVIPVVIISNTMMNRLVDQITAVDPGSALSRAIDMTRESMIADADSLRTECEWLGYALENDLLSIDSVSGRRHVSKIMETKGYVFQCYSREPGDRIIQNIVQLPGDAGATRYSEGIRSFVSLSEPSTRAVISRVTVDSSPVLAGVLYRNSMILALYRVIPEERTFRIKSFEQTLFLYDRKIESRPFMRSITGLIMLILAIVVVIISISLSLYLSQSITRPLLELEKAAKDVAAGDLSVSLKRGASDEFAALFGSFNAMVRQLRENKEAVYVAQKLNAWREVSRKLLHEIKNPLTPIKLSAERIRIRYSENHPDIQSIVMKGTETIIDEVGAIQSILNEFTSFARLPEINPTAQSMNEAILDYVALFHGHENIRFVLNLSDSLPPVCFDRLLMRQAVINIVKNAIEAMSDNGEIVISTGLKDGRYIFVTIKDTGPGILSSDLPRLFDPTFSRKKSGTGLGLSIVEKIALDHKGRVYCTSVPGQGAAFTIELPVG